MGDLNENNAVSPDSNCSCHDKKLYFLMSHELSIIFFVAVSGSDLMCCKESGHQQR